MHFLIFLKIFFNILNSNLYGRVFGLAKNLRVFDIKRSVQAIL